MTASSPAQDPRRQWSRSPATARTGGQSRSGWAGRVLVLWRADGCIGTRKDFRQVRRAGVELPGEKNKVMTSLRHVVFLAIRMAAYTSNKFSLASTRLRCILDSTLPVPLHSSTPAPFHARCALLLPRGSPTSSLGLLPPPSLRPSDDSSPARRGHQEGMSGAASRSHGRNRGPPGA